MKPLPSKTLSDYPMAELWALRLALYHIQKLSRLVLKNQFLQESYTKLLSDDADDEEQYSPDDLKAFIQQRCLWLETQAQPDTLLIENVRELGRLLSLSATERSVLLFICLCEKSPVLSYVMDEHLDFSERSAELFITAMAVAMNTPRDVITQVFSGNSALVRSRLLKPRFSQQFHQIDIRVIELLFNDTKPVEAILSLYTQQAQPSELEPDAFLHIADDYDTLRSYLKVVSQRAVKGVNILLYGAPGSGKTQMVRTLARQIGLDLYEVKCTDRAGAASKSMSRFDSYVMSQQMLLAHKTSLVLFDEVEDVFHQEVMEGRKAWINNILEENPRPAIWVCNDIDSMDKAFVRRFDIVMKMPVLSEASRVSMLGHLCKGLPVSDEWLQRTASCTSLQPGHIQRAVMVVKRLRIRRSDRVEKTLNDLLGNLYLALQEPWMPVKGKSVPQRSLFSPEFANTDCRIEVLKKGLEHSGTGRILLYGPPGTGKTTLGTSLSTLLNKPLLQKKASDLLGPFVGETERNIAAVFHEAARQNAILMIDEADTFLLSRDSAHNSWEISQVNELLQQVEQFNGILVMATNLLDLVDAAAMRRFDFKIRFDYLRYEQALGLFERLMNSASGEGEWSGLDEHGCKRLQRMHLLTPGDFAVVQRKAQVLAQPLTVEFILTNLQQEHDLKTRNQSRVIGFV